MVKGIVFDKDGTLLEYESFWLPVAKNAIKLLLELRTLYDDKPAEEMLENVGAYDGISGILCHGTYLQIIEKFNEVIMKTNPETELFSVDEAEECFRQSIHCGKLEATCGDIAGTFERLKKMDLKVALITSDNEELSRVCLKELGVLTYFDELYAADGVHPSKPDPYYMNCFCEKYGLSPAEVIMVGDTMTDMNFAKNSGTIALGVAKNNRDRETLFPHAYKVVNDISCVFDVIDEINKAGYL